MFLAGFPQKNGCWRSPKRHTKFVDEVDKNGGGSLEKQVPIHKLEGAYRLYGTVTNENFSGGKSLTLRVASCNLWI